MQIAFSRPLIDQDVINEVNNALTKIGWLTSGPQTKALAQEIARLTGTDAVLCVNSWTAGAMLALRWFGIGPGDEVIVPAYTYCATALAVMNIGAKPVMVDVTEDFTIDPEEVRKAVNKRTKAIIPVDIGGWPCDYNALFQLVQEPEVKGKFAADGVAQEKLGRILVLADAAHSIGAGYRGVQSGRIADITAFSFHSVKNITTGEGGAICLNLPSPFDNGKELEFFQSFALNGQTKSALEKNQSGGWKYDIVSQGLKANMPDICASIGLAQIRKYRGQLLPERRRIFSFYSQQLGRCEWAILPSDQDDERTSSCHLYQLRIKDITEVQRDAMIQSIADAGVGVNVHYIPMPMLTLFKSKGYRIEDYPMTYELFRNEITLPLYNGLSQTQLEYVVRSVVRAYEKVVGKAELRDPIKSKAGPVRDLASRSLAPEGLAASESSRPNS